MAKNYRLNNLIRLSITKLVGLDNILQKYIEIHKYSIQLEIAKRRGKITYIVFLLASIFHLNQ